MLNEIETFDELLIFIEYYRCMIVRLLFKEI